MSSETILAVVAGVGLAAACGFRVFVPLLVLGAAARAGHLDLVPGFAWLAGTPALLALGVATAVEILAYHVPWLDHVLDLAGAPLAILAGVTVVAASVDELSPVLRWALAIIAGGGAAGLFQGWNGLLRVGSTVHTAGIGNAVLASLETAGAFSLAGLAVLLPVAVFAVPLALITLGIWLALRRRHR